MKALVLDLSLAVYAEALKGSTTVELSEDGTAIRRHTDRRLRTLGGTTFRSRAEVAAHARGLIEKERDAGRAAARRRARVRHRPAAVPRAREGEGRASASPPSPPSAATRRSPRHERLRPRPLRRLDRGLFVHQVRGGGVPVGAAGGGRQGRRRRRRRRARRRRRRPRREAEGARRRARRGRREEGGARVCVHEGHDRLRAAARRRRDAGLAPREVRAAAAAKEGEVHRVRRRPAARVRPLRRAATATAALAVEGVGTLGAAAPTRSSTGTRSSAATAAAAAARAAAARATARGGPRGRPRPRRPRQAARRPLRVSKGRRVRVWCSEAMKCEVRGDGMRCG